MATSLVFMCLITIASAEIEFLNIFNKASISENIDPGTEVFVLHINESVEQSKRIWIPSLSTTSSDKNIPPIFIFKELAGKETFEPPSLPTKLTIVYESGKLTYGNVYSIQVSIEYRHTKVMKAATDIDVTVGRIPPEFVKKVWEFSIPESAKPGSRIGQIVGVSFSDFKMHYYVSAVSAPSNAFKIDHDTGWLTLQASLDYETVSASGTNLFELIGFISEESPEGLTNQGKIWVTLEDSNDCTPVFDQLLYVKNVSEATPLYSEILQVSAKDCDGTSPNNEVTYSSSDDHFIIDNDGMIKLEKKLSYEHQKYLFEITATDRGNPPKSGKSVVKIFVENANNQAPVFINTYKNKGYYNANVSESITTDTIIAKVDAFDPDGLKQEIKYYFHDTSNHPFEIVSQTDNTGIVKLKNKGQLRLEPPYNLTIRATDDTSKPPEDSHYNNFTFLVINVHEENTYKPEFSGCVNLNPVIPEDLKIGSEVFRISATDKDAGVHGQVKYGIVGIQKTKSEFQIETVLNESYTDDKKLHYIGIVRLAANLSTESGNVRKLTINATDGYNGVTLPPKGSNVAFCTVSVNIKSINFHPPEFVSVSYFRNIYNRQALNTNVMKVYAFDKDSEIITYKLLGNDLTKFFKINQKNGVIQIKRTLTVAPKKVIGKVEASDGEKTSSANVTFNITDYDGTHIPEFKSFLQTVKVQENKKGISLCNISGQVYSKDKLGKNAFGKFSLTEKLTLTPSKFEIPPVIGGNTAELRLVEPLDYETSKTHFLVVKLEDSINSDLYTYETITVQVEDVNDEAPMFIAPSDGYYAVVNEDEDIGSHVLTVHAVDRDTGNGGVVRFFIKKEKVSEDYSYFQINDTSGEITIKKSLRNTASRIAFVFVVKAKDSAPPYNEKSIYVTVKVNDINDNVPVFLPTSYHASVKEDAPIGQKIVKLSATDADQMPGQDDLIYQIASGNVGAAFTIEGQDILVSKSLDVDKGLGPMQYTMIVHATDGKFAGSAKVVIDVEDINDEPATFDKNLYECVVDENFPGPDIPDCKVSARDGDRVLNNRLTYSIDDRGRDKEFFNIDSNSGQIRLLKPLDFEFKDTWNLIVRAEEVLTARQGATTDVRIVVRDVDDQAPYFNIKDQFKRIAENSEPGAPVLTMSATDTDTPNSALTYSLIGGTGYDAGLFEIDKDTGKVSTKVQLDHESPLGYIFTLVAKVEDPMGLSGTGTVTIEVFDVNDNAPKCGKTNYQATVSEGAKDGSRVFMFEIEDKDTAASNGNNKVEIYEGNSNGGFKISEPTAYNQVYLIKTSAVDYESQYKSFLIKLKVYDSMISNSDVSYCVINVTITDANDNAPEFVEPVTKVSFSEDTDLGTEIAKVTATDKDENGNQKIQFEIDRSTDKENWFSVKSDPSNPNVGIITLEKPLDKEDVGAGVSPNGVKTFNVLAIDQPANVEEKRLHASAEIEVEISNINDNAPVFAKNYQPAVKENLPPGQFVVKLEAIDFDGDQDLPASFKLADGFPDNKNFELIPDTNTGTATLKTKVPFDREKQPEYDVAIELCDNAKNMNAEKQCAVRHLPVKVLDENDSPPSDGVVYIHAYVWPVLAEKVELPPMIPFGFAEVEDGDCCDHSSHTYAFAANTDENVKKSFIVENKTGEIKLKSGLTAGIYNFNVNVTDHSFKKSVTSHIKVIVEELTEKSLENSVAVKLKGYTSKTFIQRDEVTKKRPIDEFISTVAKLIGTKNEHVEVFNIIDSKAASEEPVYPDIFEPPEITVVFSAHGSPYYAPDKITGLLVENQENIEGNGVLKFGQIPVDQCVIECPKSSCLTDMKFVNSPSVTVSQDRALIGIKVTPEAKCDVCGAKTVTIPYPDKSNEEEDPDPCSKKPCLHNGRCISETVGYKNNQYIYSAYRCECSFGYEGYNCQKTSMSFSNDGYAWFPSLPACSDLTITLEFATQKKNGLLLYNGPMTEISNEQGSDFIALEIVDNVLRLAVNVGGGVSELLTVSHPSRTINDGKWHRVDITISPSSVSAMLDMCEGSLIYSEIDGAPTQEDLRACRVQSYLRGDILNVATPLQLGGVVTSEPFKPNVHHKTFDGCIQKLSINDELVDMASYSDGKNVDLGCSRSDIHCNDGNDLRCGLHGDCVSNFLGFESCNCHPFYTGIKCDERTPEFFFNDSSIVKYQMQPSAIQISDKLTNLQMSFRTRLSDPPLNMQLFNIQGQSIAQYIRVMIDSDGYLAIFQNLGGQGEFSVRLEHFVADGVWHTFLIERFGKRFFITLDDGGPNKQVVFEKGQFSLMKADPSSVMVGGFLRESYSGLEIISNFKGCMSDIRFNSLLLPVDRDSLFNGISIDYIQGIEEGCNVDDCAFINCPLTLTCAPFFLTAACVCPFGKQMMGKTCIDINECLTDNPCLNDGVCTNYEDARMFHCECVAPYSGKRCGVLSESLVMMSTLSLEAILIFILCIIILLLLLCIFLVYKGRRTMPGMLTSDLDVDHNVGIANTEGGGQQDQDFNIAPLRKPIDPPFVMSTPVEPNGVSPTARTPIGHSPDVGPYLHGRIPGADKETDDRGGRDTLMVYHNEGVGSDCGTNLSHPEDQAHHGDPDYDQFNQWGPPFTKLASMFGDNPNNNAV